MEGLCASRLGSACRTRAWRHKDQLVIRPSEGGQPLGLILERPAWCRAKEISLQLQTSGEKVAGEGKRQRQRLFFPKFPLWLFIIPHVFEWWYSIQHGTCSCTYTTREDSSRDCRFDQHISIFNCWILTKPFVSPITRSKPYSILPQGFLCDLTEEKDDACHHLVTSTTAISPTWPSAPLEEENDFDETSKA